MVKNTRIEFSLTGFQPRRASLVGSVFVAIFVFLPLVEAFSPIWPAAYSKMSESYPGNVRFLFSQNSATISDPESGSTIYAKSIRYLVFPENVSVSVTKKRDQPMVLKEKTGAHTELLSFLGLMIALFIIGIKIRIK